MNNRSNASTTLRLVFAVRPRTRNCRTWASLLRGSGQVRWIVAALAVLMTAGCARTPQATLTRLLEARRLSADLLVQFSAAADAANRAVMADTDEASIAFAHEADTASGAIQQDREVLMRVLRELAFSDEVSLLEEFGRRFTDYRKLDGSILELAVENTNVKAQRISFGPAQDAVDGFRESLTSLPPTDEGGRTATLVATAIASVREIQVLQAPHIAESDETAMTRMEQQMAAAETAARSALASLGDSVQPASRSQLAAATAALDRFVAFNAQIVTLSRRNTNVRSLALTLGQKRALTAACEDSLRSLQSALGKRGFTATR